MHEYELTEIEKQAMSLYKKQWRATHPDSAKKAQKRFAQKQAKLLGLLDKPTTTTTTEEN